MATDKKLNRPEQPAAPAMTRDERKFWDQAFFSAELPLLLKARVKRLTPEAAAHLCAEYATAATAERRRVLRVNR